MAKPNYNQHFFDLAIYYTQHSSKIISELLWRELAPRSVLDVGCGIGIWLRAWKECGVAKIMGLDGNYVDEHKLWVPPTAFSPTDLNGPFDLNERFDLVQSLEVAEHLRPSSAEGFVDSLVRHSDLIFFSAAVVGQGGEGHLNERPLEYWRELFFRRGFNCYDWVRPKLHDVQAINPWYRFNTFLYASESAHRRLSDAVLSSVVPPGQKLARLENLAWRIRCAVFSKMPPQVTNSVARFQALYHSQRFRRMSH